MDRKEFTKKLWELRGLCLDIAHHIEQQQKKDLKRGDSHGTQ